MDDRSRLYFEGHITLEPPKPEQQLDLDIICRRYNMRLSTFALIKDDSPTPDAFISCRNESYTGMVVVIHAALCDLFNAGFSVKRVKIEDTLYDTKHGDAWMTGPVGKGAITR